MHDFIYDKWGDIVALSILFAGMGLVVLVPEAKETGSGLIMASLGLLKLTRTFKTNGNGNGAAPAAPQGEQK